MKELVEYIVKGLVAKPEEVLVKEVKGESTTVYEVSVAADERGKVIGKRGKTIQAIRATLQAAAIKQKTRAILEVIE